MADKFIVAQSALEHTKSHLQQVGARVTHVMNSIEADAKNGTDKLKGAAESVKNRAHEIFNVIGEAEKKASELLDDLRTI